MADEVKVTQAARRAAFQVLPPETQRDLEGTLYLNGPRDNTPLIQAFARFEAMKDAERQAAVLAEREACRDIADKWGDHCVRDEILGRYDAQEKADREKSHVHTLAKRMGAKFVPRKDNQ